MLEAAYELLRVTPPFRGWKLPHADDIIFIAGANRKNMGHCYQRENGDIEICVSMNNVQTLDTLLKTMAHEMCHLHELKLKVMRQGVEHSATFHRLADRVCYLHKWDRGAF